MHAGVLEKELLLQLKTPLQKLKPMKAVFDQSYVKRLNGKNVKTGPNKMDLAKQLIAEIAEWKRKNKCSRVVMIWAASTEIFLKPHPVHKTIDTFEKAMKENHKSIAPSMIYAYAALKSDSVCQWRAKSHSQHSGAENSRRTKQISNLWQRVQDRANSDEDHDCPRS